MNFLVATVILLLSASVQCDTKLADSYGTEFVTVFPPNNGKIDETGHISLDIMSFYSDAKVEIYYSILKVNGWEVKRERHLLTFNMSKEKFLSVKLDSNIMYPYVAPGINRYPNSMIRIRSTAPVQVLAHSYTKDGAGDTYAVLPITMASTSYSFSLPSTADGGLSMVYFLPAGSDAEISVKLKTKDSQQTMNFDIKKDDSSDMMMLGGPNKPFTVYAKGSAPFVVLIASKQVSVGGKYRDFMCTMPMSDAWKSKPKKDNTPQHYLADVSTSAYFYVTPPEDVKQIDVHGSNGESKQISAKDLGHKMRSFADENLGTHVDIVGKSLQVERIGDPHSNGVFLDMIPAYNQWLTGPAAFRPRHKGDQLLIFGENVTAKSCELAFKPAQSPPSWKQIKGIFGGSVFATSVKTLNADPLIITSACPYVALVVGTRDHHAYAYTPAMNLPNSRAPPPPAPKTTTIPSTSTTTSTTTTSPTTSSTTSTTSPDTVPTKATAGSTARTFATTAGASNCAPVIALTLFSIVDAIIR